MAAGGEEAYRKQQEELEKKASNIFAAEEHFRVGEMALRRNQFDVAYEEFKKAVTLNPDEGEHHALLGWATWMTSDDKDEIVREIEKVMRRALKLSPKCVPAFYYLGQLAKHRNDTAGALEHFEQVLRMQPSNREARQEIRLLRSRQR
jgi:cytochrome c-type biogenesis protein CcmH/NrfG